MNSHHPAWDKHVPADAAGEIILEWCLNEDMVLANTGAPTRRRPNSQDRSSPDITLYRDCTVSQWTSTLSADSDHYWITYEVAIGPGMDMISTTKPVRKLFSWNKADIGLCSGNLSAPNIDIEPQRH